MEMFLGDFECTPNYKPTVNTNRDSETESLIHPQVEYEKMPTPKKAPAKKTTKREAVTLDMEDVVDIDLEKEIKVQEKNLPSNDVVLRDANGKEVPLEIMAINKMSVDIGKKMSSLNDEILTKVSAADNELNEGIYQILALTQSVDMNSLTPHKNQSWIAKIKARFVDTKVRVMSEFTTVSDQVIAISNKLSTSVDRMESESKWIDNVAKEQKKYINDITTMHVNVKEVYEAQQALLEQMKDDPNINILDIEEKKLVVETLEKQADKLLRLKTLSIHMAPQIVAIKKVNIDSIDKFVTLQTDVLPAWKSNLGLALLAQRQEADLEMANTMQDRFNESLIQASERIGENLKNSAIAGQRSVVDNETLRIVQTNTINAVREASTITSRGVETRKNAENEMLQLNNQLEAELRSIMDKE